MAPYRTEAVVLRTYDLGETDKILVLFSKDEGKLSAVAKGARKPRGRFVAGSQLFVHCDYLLHTGRTLDVVTQYEIINAHRRIREDLEKLAYASYSAELVLEMTHDRDPSPQVFMLVLWTLDNIEAGRNLEALSHVFELRLLELLGYRPQLTVCALCGKEVRGAGRFCAAAGGVVCNKCSTGAATVRVVSEGALMSLKTLQEGPVNASWSVLKLDGEVGAEIRRVMEDFVTYHAEKRLRSLDFLRSIRQLK